MIKFSIPSKLPPKSQGRNNSCTIHSISMLDWWRHKKSNSILSTYRVECKRYRQYCIVVCWPILNICNCLQRLFNNACYRLAENCTWICTFIFISHRIFREVCVKGISRNYEKQYILRNYNYKLSQNSNLNENKDNNVKKYLKFWKVNLWNCSEIHRTWLTHIQTVSMVCLITK